MVGFITNRGIKSAQNNYSKSLAQLNTDLQQVQTEIGARFFNVRNENNAAVNLLTVLQQKIDAAQRLDRDKRILTTPEQKIADRNAKIAARNAVADSLNKVLANLFDLRREAIAYMDRDEVMHKAYLSKINQQINILARHPFFQEEIKQKYAEVRLSMNKHIQHYNENDPHSFESRAEVYLASQALKTLDDVKNVAKQKRDIPVSLGKVSQLIGDIEGVVKPLDIRQDFETLALRKEALNEQRSTNLNQFYQHASELYPYSNNKNLAKIKGYGLKDKVNTIWGAAVGLTGFGVATAGAGVGAVILGAAIVATAPLLAVLSGSLLCMGLVTAVVTASLAREALAAPVPKESLLNAGVVGLSSRKAISDGIFTPPAAESNPPAPAAGQEQDQGQRHRRSQSR